MTRPSRAHKKDYEVVYPRGHARWVQIPSRPPGDVLSQIMIPASLLYKTFSGLARSIRARRRRDNRHASAVISVGNVEVGGNGKTPFAIHLIGRLTDGGQRPVYVSRGFKSEADSLDLVTVLVPEMKSLGGAVSCRVRVLNSRTRLLTQAIGDEGAMVAMRCPEVPLLFGRDRQRAVEVACEMFDPTHIILDDSFQTWSVARDWDIVLLDAARPLGNGRVVPAGSLREDPTALRRADVIGFNGLEGPETLETLAKWICGVVGRNMPVFGILRSLSFVDGESGATREAPGEPTASLCSVGRPSRFEAALVAHGVDLGLSLRYADHHRYLRDDIRSIDGYLADRGIQSLVTTEKDWVKLREVGAPSSTLCLARLELGVIGENPMGQYEKPRGEPAASSLDA